jgi:hypothetical protein
MSATERTAGCAGRWLGRVWRALVRQEVRLTHWMIGHGMPKVVAASILWLFKLAVFAILLYAAFWFGVLLVFAAIAAWIAGRVDADAQSTEWAIGEQAEHKQSVFYDPINYNDTPDPRFDDE